MTRGMHTKQADAVAAAGTTKTFNAGDKVKWTSQAAGSWKEKVGSVVVVVPANTSPHPNSGFSGLRDHESYIVNVPTKTGKGKGTNYWPLVSKLQKA